MLGLLVFAKVLESKGVNPIQHKYCIGLTDEQRQMYIAASERCKNNVPVLDVPFCELFLNGAEILRKDAYVMITAEQETNIKNDLRGKIDTVSCL